MASPRLRLRIVAVASAGFLLPTALPDAPSAKQSAAPATVIEERRLDLEQQRIDLDRERIRSEIGFREQELPLRRDELAADGDGDDEFDWSSPLVLTLLGAIAGLLGNALVAHLNGRAQIRQSAEKARSDIVLSALKSGDVEKVKQNLLLLAKTRLLDNAETRDAIVEFVEGLSVGVGPGLDSRPNPDIGSSPALNAVML